MGITATRPFHDPHLFRGNEIEAAECDQPLEVSDSEMASKVEEVAQAVETFCEKHADNPNFVIRVRNLVNRILEQLNLIAEKDRKQTEELKKDYRTHSQQAADLTRKLGNAGFYISLAAFGVMLAQFAPIPLFNDADRAITKFFAEQIPQGGQMFTAGINSDKLKEDALTQLLLQEYSAKTSKTSSESGSKQEVLQLLQAILELLKRASSAQ